MPIAFSARPAPRTSGGPGRRPAGRAPLAATVVALATAAAFLGFTGAAAASSGVCQAAYHATDGDLAIYNTGTGAADLGVAMAPGTSPAIASLTVGGYEEAFQGTDGALWLDMPSSGAVDTGQGMAPNTSPAIIPQPNGGYETAFQANTGVLIVYGDGAVVNTDLGMMADTSPSITETAAGGFEVAFEANNGVLWFYSLATGGQDTGQGMARDTSPAITALAAGGFESAFQANTGKLIVLGNGGNVTTGQAMVAGTSPSIAGIYSPYSGMPAFQVVYQGPGDTPGDPNAASDWDYVIGGTPSFLDLGWEGSSPAIATNTSGALETAFDLADNYLGLEGSAAIGTTTLTVAGITSAAVAC